MVQKGRGLLKRKRGDGGQRNKKAFSYSCFVRGERESDCLACQGLQMY